MQSAHLEADVVGEDDLGVLLDLLLVILLGDKLERGGVARAQLGLAVRPLPAVLVLHAERLHLRHK